MQKREQAVDLRPQEVAVRRGGREHEDQEAEGKWVQAEEQEEMLCRGLRGC
jgi:hypothetical protein